MRSSANDAVVAQCGKQWMQTPKPVPFCTTRTHLRAPGSEGAIFSTRGRAYERTWRSVGEQAMSSKLRFVCVMAFAALSHCGSGSNSDDAGDAGAAGAAGDAPPASANAGACADSGVNESRYLHFADCGSYTLKNIGLYGVQHNASTVVVYDGVDQAPNYLLSELGVYAMAPVERTGDSDPTLLPKPVNVFTLEANVIDGAGDIVPTERMFMVHRPSGYDPTKLYPVVFAFHGHGGNAQGWIHMLGDLADKHEFIGVYPQGYVDRSLNRPQTSWNLGLEESTADDVEFVADILATDVILHLSPDASMRYGLGNSNGAAMISFLAANAKEPLFSGIGMTVSGLIKSEDGATTTTNPVNGKTYSYGLLPTSPPLNVVAIFGMSDPIIPYCGGEAVTGYTMLSAEENIRAWAKQAGCAAAETEPVSLFTTTSTTSVDISDL